MPVTICKLRRKGSMIEKVILAIALTFSLYWSIQIKPQPRVVAIEIEPQPQVILMVTA
jgi:hypothetical protein